MVSGAPGRPRSRSAGAFACFSRSRGRTQPFGDVQATVPSEQTFVGSGSQNQRPDSESTDGCGDGLAAFGLVLRSVAAQDVFQATRVVEFAQ